MEATTHDVDRHWQATKALPVYSGMKRAARRQIPEGIAGLAKLANAAGELSHDRKLDNISDTNVDHLSGVVTSVRDAASEAIDTLRALDTAAAELGARIERIRRSRG